MEYTIRASDLARSLGDVLSKVRYRGDSFVIKRNGMPVARVVPIDRTAFDATLGEALTAWCDGATDDHAFADDLDAVNAADEPMGVVNDASALVAAERRREGDG